MQNIVIMIVLIATKIAKKSQRSEAPADEKCQEPAEEVEAGSQRGARPILVGASMGPWDPQVAG